MAVIIIEDWMIQDRKLSGLDLLAFALIHSCTQKGDGCWYGGYDKLSERIGGTQRGTVLAVNRLLGNGAIEKFSALINGKERTAFKSKWGENSSVDECTKFTNYSEQNSDNNKVIVNNKKVSTDAIERIYALYPTKCPVRNASTAKSFKCKEKIERLLRDHTEEELTYIIKRYLEETLGKHYLKDFSTILNNLPDYSSQSTQAQPMSARDIEWERTKRDGMKEEEEARERSRQKLLHDIAAGIIKPSTNETDGSLNL